MLSIEQRGKHLEENWRFEFMHWCQPPSHTNYLFLETIQNKLIDSSYYLKRAVLRYWQMLEYTDKAI